jgi:hypothetical protein
MQCQHDTVITTNNVTSSCLVHFITFFICFYIVLWIFYSVECIFRSNILYIYTRISYIRMMYSVTLYTHTYRTHIYDYAKRLDGVKCNAVTLTVLYTRVNIQNRRNYLYVHVLLTRIPTFRIRLAVIVIIYLIFKRISANFV